MDSKDENDLTMDGVYLTFKSPANYETKTSYEFDVIATDEDVGTLSATIPVTGLNEAPDLNDDPANYK